MMDRLPSDTTVAWPGADRRFPSMSHPDYIGAQALSVAIQSAVVRELKGKENLRVLDIGCGQKPFWPFFAPYCSEYVGTDIGGEGTEADKICPAEQLAVDDGWADVVLCFSVLEHVDEPNTVIRELCRVTKPGGIIMASTHGCFPWHPSPHDHWRWTQTGLPLLFRRNGSFASVDISATRGSLSGIFFLLAHYASQWCCRGPLRRMIRVHVVRMINWTGIFIDGRTPSLRDLSRRVTAIPEFFVIARKDP